MRSLGTPVNQKHHFSTLAIHAGHGRDTSFGAVMTPIYQTSTFAFQGVNQPGPYDYSRSGNPTRKALETCLAALEGGQSGFAFGTGMAAETTVAMLFKPGEHMIVHNDLYGGTYRLLSAIMGERGLALEYVDLRDQAAVRAAMRPETRAIWIESPTNPCMNLVDLEAVARIGREAGVLTICDNTFLSPYFQRPLEMGVDIVVHSTTKYINGHSDVVGGAVVVRDPALGERIGYLQNALGTCQAPFDCFLVLRGIKTLAVRMEAHNRNALEIARWLERHPKVASRATIPDWNRTRSMNWAGGRCRATAALFLPREGRAGRGFPAARRSRGVHAGGVPGRGGIADRAPHHHDPRLHPPGGAGGHGDHPGPDPHLRGDRRRARPDRRPRRRAGPSLSALSLAPTPRCSASSALSGFDFPISPARFSPRPPRLRGEGD